MKTTLVIVSLFSALLFGACHKNDEMPLEVFVSDFSKTLQNGWVAGFSDYSDQYEGLQLQSGIMPLPAAVNPSMKEQGFMIQGENRPDDLFMFLKRKMQGLEPNTTYIADLQVRFATDAPDNALGIGGSPSKSVYVKAGIVNKEPMALKDSTGYYRMNIDKGNQGTPGKDTQDIGDVSNGLEDKTEYVSVLRKAENIRVTTNDKGECWLIVGTDSGYEGFTQLFYQRIEVRFRKP